MFVIPASVLGSLVPDRPVWAKTDRVWGFIAGAVVLVAFGILRSQFANLALLAYIVYGLFNVALTGPGLVSGAGIYGVELGADPHQQRSPSRSL